MKLLCQLAILSSLLSILASCGQKIIVPKVSEYKTHTVTQTKVELLQELESQLTAIAGDKKRLGFGTVILNKDSIFFKKGFGYANAEEKIHFTEKTVMPIGSISKTIAGISLLKCQELSLIQLDDPVNDYLPFALTNPHFPNQKITIRQVATHTSSLLYTEFYEHSYLFDTKIPDQFWQSKKGKEKKEVKAMIDLYNNNEKMDMVEFVKHVYHKDGKWYADKNYDKNPPGTAFHYCNENAAIAAIIVGAVSNMKYTDFVEQHITKPLGMENSSWSMNDFSISQRGQLYFGDHAMPTYHLITYPDGGFVTCIEDFSAYFQTLIQGYYSDNEILSQESYQTIMLPQFEGEEDISGIFMEITKDNIIGHNGGDPGIITFAYFDAETSYGYIIFFKNDERIHDLVKTLNAVKKTAVYLSMIEN